MEKILSAFAGERSVRTAIKADWENYRYCLGYAPNVELSIGRYLTWLITDPPDYFMNLNVCIQLPSNGVDKVVDKTLAHFWSKKMRKFSWPAREGTQTIELNNVLPANGLTFRESFATEMAVAIIMLFAIAFFVVGRAKR